MSSFLSYDIAFKWMIVTNKNKYFLFSHVPNVCLCIVGGLFNTLVDYAMLEFQKIREFECKIVHLIFMTKVESLIIRLFDCRILMT